MTAAVLIACACLAMLLLMGLAATGVYAVPLVALWRVVRKVRT